VTEAPTEQPASGVMGFSGCRFFVLASGSDFACFAFFADFADQEGFAIR
jgi:hypothetical protein